METFHGIWPALVTPFTADDRVNTAVLRDLVEHLLSKGVHGFYVCGNTGQGLSMSVDERRLVAQEVIQQVAGRVPVIVHVGSPVVRDAVALARHAREAGASGVSSVIPPYFQGESAILAYYRQIAQAVPELTVWPYILDARLDVPHFVRQLAEIPNVKGVKYTGSDMFELQDLLGLRREEWRVFSGMDEQFAFAAMFGAHGAIGSTVNLMPGLYHGICQAVGAGDYHQAVQIQEQINAVIRLMYRADFRGALVEALAVRGFDCGAPRLPGRPLTASEQRELRAGLEALDFQALE